MPYREFADQTGVEWRVWDTRPTVEANVRPSFASGWLSFQSATQRRRLSPIPDHWDTAGEGQLRAWLSESRAMSDGESTAAGRLRESTGAKGTAAPRPEPRAAAVPEASVPVAAPALPPLVSKITSDSNSALARAREVLRAVNHTLGGTRPADADKADERGGTP